MKFDSSVAVNVLHLSRALTPAGPGAVVGELAARQEGTNIPPACTATCSDMYDYLTKYMGLCTENDTASLQACINGFCNVGFFTAAPACLKCMQGVESAADSAAEIATYVGSLQDSCAQMGYNVDGGSDGNSATSVESASSPGATTLSLHNGTPEASGTGIGSVESATGGTGAVSTDPVDRASGTSTAEGPARTSSGDEGLGLGGGSGGGISSGGNTNANGGGNAGGLANGTPVRGSGSAVPSPSQSQGSGAGQTSLSFAAAVGGVVLALAF